MLKSKSFLKKTKKGSVVKIVREHYLRDDIGCGSQGCLLTECHRSESMPILSDDPIKLPNFSPKGHYILPDTNILLRQVDVMEHAAIKDVIIAQTALEELKHLSFPVFNRIRSLISDSSKRFYVFSNEHHAETYIERESGEIINDRNDRAIRQVCTWYRNHLRKFDIILITEDMRNLDLAKREGILCLTMAQYAEGYAEKVPELIDLVASPSENQAITENLETFGGYEEYWSPSRIQGGLKTGDLHQGAISINCYNLLEGSVMIDRFAKPVLISGRFNLNRATHQDSVVIEVFPKTEWRQPSDNLVEEPDGGSSETDLIEESLIVESLLHPTGRVVSVTQRNWRPYCGTLDLQIPSSIPREISAVQAMLFCPMEKRIPKIRIKTRQASSLISKRFVVVIDGWDIQSKYPHGHFVKVLGPIGEKETETEALLLEHEVIHRPFSERILSSLPDASWHVKPTDLQNRIDLRHLTVFSIDPPGCTDIDDALHVVKLENGHFEVGIHIADVSHFVKHNDPVDKEARERGTTVYLIDKRIDMLPPVLGTNICSLRSQVDRLTFSCILELNEDAEILNSRFSKSIIRSRHSFTYEEAQAKLDSQKTGALGGIDDIVIVEALRNLNDLAKKLGKRRKERGALTLASPEVRFQLENDSQDPVDVEMKELRETNALVEEFMLLANCCVANKIYDHFKASALLRSHPSPSPANFESLARALGRFNFRLDAITSSKTLGDALDAAVRPDEPYFNHLIRILATRCMTQAIYICSGSVLPAEYHHYGLAIDSYTHFTSPIRRYADLLVHRMLAIAIQTDSAIPELLDTSTMNTFCTQLNFRHRMAQQASRDSVELFTLLFFKNKVLEEEAFVTRVLRNGFVVLILKYGIEGIVYTSDIGKSSTLFVFDGNQATLTYQTTEICLFMRVLVQISVDSSNIAKQRLTLKLVEPSIPGYSVPALSSKKLKLDSGS